MRTCRPGSKLTSSGCSSADEAKATERQPRTENPKKRTARLHPACHTTTLPTAYLPVAFKRLGEVLPGRVGVRRVMHGAAERVLFRHAGFAVLQHLQGFLVHLAGTASVNNLPEGFSCQDQRLRGREAGPHRQGISDPHQRPAQKRGRTFSSSSVRCCASSVRSPSGPEMAASFLFATIWRGVGFKSQRRKVERRVGFWRNPIRDMVQGRMASVEEAFHQPSV